VTLVQSELLKQGEHLPPPKSAQNALPLTSVKQAQRSLRLHPLGCAQKF
jgi:hypothetical protein